jgi:hypothetical protein
MNIILCISAPHTWVLHVRFRINPNLLTHHYQRPPQEKRKLEYLFREILSTNRIRKLIDVKINYKERESPASESTMERETKVKGKEKLLSEPVENRSNVHETPVNQTVNAVFLIIRSLICSLQSRCGRSL